MDHTDRRVDHMHVRLDLSVRVTARIGSLDMVRKLGSSRLLTVAAPGYLAS